IWIPGFSAVILAQAITRQLCSGPLDDMRSTRMYERREQYGYSLLTFARVSESRSDSDERSWFYPARAFDCAVRTYDYAGNRHSRLFQSNPVSSCAHHGL